MPDEQNQEVEAQANTAEVTAAETPIVETPVTTPAAETPAADAVEAPVTTPAAETPITTEAPAETPEVKVEPKKRVSGKAKAAAEKLEKMPVQVPAAETPIMEKTAADAVEAPVTAPAAETPAPVQATKSGFSWGKRKESSNTAVQAEKCEIKVTNKGAYTFEVYTRTPLPSNQVTVVTCESTRQRSAIIDKLEKLNALSGTQRYVIEG